MAQTEKYQQHVQNQNKIAVEQSVAFCHSAMDEVVIIDCRSFGSLLLTLKPFSGVRNDLLFIDDNLPHNREILISDPIFIDDEEEMNLPHNREILISGVYSADASGKSEAVKLKMEHCAKLSLGHKWNVAVKVCAQDLKISQKKKFWVDIKELYPDAIVEMSKNSIEVTLNSPKENHQFAVFGTPDVIDKKRMQLGLFGEKPVTGKDWKIIAILFDDTVMAYQHVCKVEKARGRQLLTTLAGLFVSNSVKDIELNIRDVELGWKVKDGKTRIIRSKDSWNSPENCTDFPRCFIEISHEDIKKRSFTFALIVSHEHDYAETEVIAYYEDPVKHQDVINVFPIKQWDDEVVVFFQVFAIIMCFIGTAFKPGTH